MKFNRIELLAATEAAIKAVEDRSVEDHERRLAEHEQARQDWLERYAADWLAVLPKLRDQIRKGRPITNEDLPKDPHGWVAALRGSGSAPKLVHYPVPGELSTLAAVLPTISDDEVTTSGLRDIGISPSALRDALRHMAKKA